MAFAFLPYDLPLAIPYRWAKGRETRRRGLLVRLEGPGGATGWGETAPPPHEPVDGAALAAAGRALVAGLDVASDRFLADLDRRDPPARLRCGIATAWLSMRAAGAGVSLARLLAAPAEPAARVPVNGLVTEAEPQAAAARAAALVAAGHRTLKIKLGADEAENLARVAAIRTAVPRAVLRVDPNEALDPGRAAAHLDALSAFGIDYAEQPIADHAPAGLARLAAASPIAIAADEAATDAEAVEALIAARAVSVLILKPQRLGGPDRLLAIASRAASAGLRTTVTNSLETAVGLASALHIAACLPPPIPDCGLGTARYFARDVAPPPEIVDGAMAVPTGPGLGIAPEPASLQDEEPT